MRLLIRGRDEFVEVEGIIWEHELPIPSIVFATKSGGMIEVEKWKIQKIEGENA